MEAFQVFLVAILTQYLSLPEKYAGINCTIPVVKSYYVSLTRPVNNIILTLLMYVKWRKTNGGFPQVDFPSHYLLMEKAAINSSAPGKGRTKQVPIAPWQRGFSHLSGWLSDKRQTSHLSNLWSVNEKFWNMGQTGDDVFQCILFYTIRWRHLDLHSWRFLP